MSFLTKLFGAQPAWARRTKYLQLTRNQVGRLETIRREVGVSHEMFVLQIASDREATKRLQRFIYKWMERKTPEMPERLLLAKLLRNRLAAAQMGGGDLFGLAAAPSEEFGVRIRRIVRAHPTIDAMAEAIAKDQKSVAGPMRVSTQPEVVDAARRITEILAEPVSTSREVPTILG